MDEFTVEEPKTCEFCYVFLCICLLPTSMYIRAGSLRKCVCIEYIAAIKKLKSQNFQPHRTVLLSYVPDEEIGGAEGMNVMLESEWFRSLKIGLALDEGLASEGDDFSVFYGERLPWWIHVTANGNTGHASRFIEGTAVEQVLCVCQKALKFRKEQKDILHGVGTHAGCSHSVATKKKQLGDVTSLNITVLRAGVQSGGSDAVNVVPPSAEAKFDIRVAPSMPTADVAATLDSWCQEVNAETVGLPTGGGVSWKLVGNPLRDHAVTATDATNPWWAVFEGILAGQCGLQLSPSVFPAATDSRFLRALGIRAFGFSPIRRSPILLHEHDEYLEEAVFIEGCEIYVTLIAGLAAQVAFDGDRDTAASTTYGGEEER